MSDALIGPGLVKLGSMQTLPPLECEVGVLALACDHSRVLAGCEDSRLRVWDFKDVADHNSFADTETWQRLGMQAEARRTRLDQARARGL
jgi:hypothetical protein